VKRFPDLASEASSEEDLILAAATHLPADTATIRRAVIGCGIGQIFEIYDFVVYGLMAGALSRAFFPSQDPIAALLSTFATFAVGFSCVRSAQW
jgi:hypothetical protein